MRSRPSKSAPVGVLGKVLKIFDVLQRHPFGVDLKTISAEAGVNKSTAYRFLTHLEREGYLMRDDAGAYMLGVKLLQLGARENHRSLLQQVAGPVVRELWKTTEETVNVGVLDGGQVLYVSVLESPHAFRLVSKIGMRRPLHSTALGKALLAFLPAEDRENLLSSISFPVLTPHTLTSLTQLRAELEKVRAGGHALDDEENVLGARCIGAAVLNARGESVAAISLSGPITRLGGDKVAVFALAVQNAARAIAARLGFNHPGADGPGHDPSGVSRETA
ncbi:MAG TPA: IclR family transcriptional regulator [Blastocatellia bacterium]|nr:IclR family transcriptional regulator [Blastocatellia bacterium]